MGGWAGAKMVAWEVKFDEKKSGKIRLSIVASACGSHGRRAGSKTD